MTIDELNFTGALYEGEISDWGFMHDVAEKLIAERDRAVELLASARGQAERFKAERDFHERRALRAERELAELRDRR